MFFSNCIECELMVIGLILFGALIVDYVMCKSRKWGENPRKWWKI